MPSLDVTQVLDCPEFYDIFEVRRTSSTVGLDGENYEDAVQSLPVQGVIVPASRTTLQRLPDLQNLTGTIEVYTRFRLNNARGLMGADTVIYRGAEYTVLDIQDYSSYGQGFVNAVCTLVSNGPENIPE